MSGWLRKRLEEASPDLLRAMVKKFAEALMSADAALSAAPVTASGHPTGQPSERRVTVSLPAAPRRSTRRGRARAAGSRPLAAEPPVMSERPRARPVEKLLVSQ